jgi:hypothetical protein
MALNIRKTEDGVLELRAEKFRMCSEWEIDLQFHFKERYTCEVLSDKSTEKRRKDAAIGETETVRAVLAEHHEKTNGAGISQVQLLKLLQTHGISKRQGPEILAAGVQNKKWRTETGQRNAVLYFLNGWKPEEAVM